MSKTMFIAGIGETRQLLRLEKMDYHMMVGRKFPYLSKFNLFLMQEFEWDGDAAGDVDLLKNKAAALLPLAIVTEQAQAVADDRHKHKLGRIYIPGFVKSFEYTSASFGTPPPLGPLPIAIADPLDGCEPQKAAEGRVCFCHCCIQELRLY